MTTTLATVTRSKPAVKRPKQKQAEAQRGREQAQRAKVAEPLARQHCPQHHESANGDDCRYCEPATLSIELGNGVEDESACHATDLENAVNEPTATARSDSGTASITAAISGG